MIKDDHADGGSLTSLHLVSRVSYPEIHRLLFAPTTSDARRIASGSGQLAGFVDPRRSPAPLRTRGAYVSARGEHRRRRAHGVRLVPNAIPCHLYPGFRMSR
ncbi:hypothetical protein EVAR_93954_1 [Eumeta japonica]|uniref:Uncharacterized protein n=1 Tax=Eumeta variegata TaxID=151549 RepID=A0A4C1TP77_EUMVA|nr:hypothetical protein EVAR_93954_1 [Eumeta japonica]